MKRIKAFLLLLMAIVMAFSSACASESELGGNSGSTVVPDSGSGDGGGSDSTVPPDGGSGDIGGDVSDPWAEYETITVEQALELCGESGNVTAERYYIRAFVKTILNPEYGEMVIEDETGEISVYGTYSADGEIGYAYFEEKFYKGDEVLLHCILQNYNGTKEVKNARLIDFISHQGEYDESDYTQMTVAQARNAESGTLVKVSGVVARITYANGFKPSGVYLIDDTQSIYVYDGDLASRVAIGNRITVLASKTYWILESEQSAASKHGYNGCNQLESAVLVSNDEKVNEFDKSWIAQSTVKEVMDTPVTEDVTTTVYKVNALVEKREEPGFVNYYFYDLDGTTGSYVYTQCSGADFGWIDEFDGKICTVYLAAHNAKSTASSCFFRFIPVDIVDEGFVFNPADAAKFAVEYYGIEQFEQSYTADPAMEVTTSVSSQLLGIENATLSYNSSNEEVISFTAEEGKTVFHCNSYGTAMVTVTGSYAGNSYQEQIEITYSKPVEYQTVTVADAIAATIGTEVTVKGIVGPSAVNQDAFYLFGEDGSVIPVMLASTTDFVGLEVGNEVIVKGKRDVRKKDTYTGHGQTYLSNGQILANNFGSHEYSTAKFITGKTVSDFYNLNASEEHSTEVYVLKGVLRYEFGRFSTTLHLDADGVSISFYCSNAEHQYAKFMEFDGEEVTVEVAVCNWNSKSYYTGCILSIHTQTGKVINTLNFDNN